MTLAAVAFGTLVFSACASKAPIASSNPKSEAESGRPMVVFEVSRRNGDDYFATPILMWRNGHYLEPPCHSGSDPSAFTERELRAGRQLVIFHDGARAGTATIGEDGSIGKDGSIGEKCFGQIVPVAVTFTEYAERSDGPWLAVSSRDADRVKGVLATVRTVDRKMQEFVGRVLIGIGASDEDAGRAQVRVWTVPVGVAVIARVDPKPDDSVNNYHRLFAIMTGDESTPAFVEYSLARGEADYCDADVVGALGLPISLGGANETPSHTAHVPALVIRFKCYEGMAYAVYSGWGRVYSGAYYGL